MVLSNPAGALRVLMVLKRTGGQGGLQIQARRVSARLRRIGVPVRVVGHSTSRLEREVDWARGVAVDYLVTPNQWSFAGRLFTYLRAHRADYDVVHVHGFGFETFAAIAARRSTGKPLIVKPSTAGPGTKLNVYARWSRRVAPLRAQWRTVDAWISISQQTRSDLLTMGVAPERILFVPNGVDTRKFRPLPRDERRLLRARLGAEEHDLVLCTVARLAPHKRVDLLIGAVRQLLESHPGLRLWVVGHGLQQPALEGLAASLGQRVRFWGQLEPPEVIQRLQASDIFCLVSLWEGLPNALLEAMACGLPVLGSQVSGTADVIQHDVNGLLVPPGDEKAVVTAIERLAREPDLRDQLAAQALRTAQEKYALQRTAERLLEVYTALAHGEALPTGGG